MGTTPNEVAAHQEAPVSMSAKVVSPEGVVWTITIRDGADKSAVSRVVQLAKDIEASMVEKGWAGYGTPPYGRAQRGSTNGSGHTNGSHAQTPPNGSAHASEDGAAVVDGAPGKLHNAYVAADGTLMCAIHGEPLHRSQYKGYYCPRPGSGPRGFCTAKFTPDKG